MENITKQNNESRWQAFMKAWEREDRPAVLSVGGVTYRVIQSALTGDREFLRTQGGLDDLYGSRSVEHG